MTARDNRSKITRYQQYFIPVAIRTHCHRAGRLPQHAAAGGACVKWDEEAGVEWRNVC